MEHGKFLGYDEEGLARYSFDWSSRRSDDSGDHIVVDDTQRFSIPPAK